VSTVERALGGPEIEVVAKATRRRFTLDYKRRIVREADGCKTPGAVGALLRREGLSSSHLATWRAARERGDLVGARKKRGPAPRVTDAREKVIAEQAREITRWKHRAERAEALVEIQKKGSGVAGNPAGRRAIVMATVADVGPRLGIAPTCAALGLSRATYYRRRLLRVRPPQRRSPRALSAEERAAVLDTLHEPRFVDLAPAEVYATLLDEGRYLCSERTMYRLLAVHDEVRERRSQLRHPRYAAPELLAHRPNELWSGDITKLLGPAKWTYFHLYVMLDVFSRYVAGWMVAHRESATLAERFIRETCARQGIERDQLTVHADRGPAMTSKPVALLLADLGVTKTHARPHVSNDNPFSEAQFKTLKYRPTFPARFGSIQDARAYCDGFFAWYNTEHRHSGLGLLTPHDVHYGLPQPPAPPVEVWINRPKTRALEEQCNTSMLASPAIPGSAAILDHLRASRYARSTLGVVGT